MANSTIDVLEPGEGFQHPVRPSLLSSAPVILVVGWKGVGRRTLIKALVKDISDFYTDILIRLRWSEVSDSLNNLNLWKVQKKIVEKMGSEYRQLEQLLESFRLYYDQSIETPPLSAIPQISKSIHDYVYLILFVIVVEDVYGHMDLKQWQEIGVPTPEKDSGPRWLISSPSRELCSGMSPDLVLEYQEVDFIPAWELIREEAADVAQTLGITGIGPLQVLECFFYSLLFSFYNENEGPDVDSFLPTGIGDVELVRCWASEGLVSGRGAVEGINPSTTAITTANEDHQEHKQQETVDEDEAAEEAEAKAVALFRPGMKLLNELVDRSMFKKHGSPARITISKHVRQRASEMVSRDRGERTSDPQLSQVSKFLLPEDRDHHQHQPQQEKQYGGGRRELAPLTSQDWEGVERISLINQGIKLLPLEPPNSPRLSTLILKSNSQLRDIPANFFLHMTSLRVLDLSFTAITSICTSTTIPNNLTLLCLLGCKSLEKIDLAGHSSLRFFSLSESPIAQLSLRGCSNLDTVDVHDLPNLEVLDLSDSGIREFYPTSLPSLKRVDLLRTKRLRRFPWDELERLPAQLHIDQCSFGGDWSNSDGAYIYVSDSRFFSNFNKDAGSRFFSGQEAYPGRFHVHLSPCAIRRHSLTEGRSISSWDGETLTPLPSKELTEFAQRDAFYYRNICSRLAAPSRPHLNKHLEIQGGNRFPEGLGALAERMESISLCGNMFVGSLTQLGSDFPSLRECHVKQCHHMEDIFDPTDQRRNVSLELLWVSDLRSLATVYHGDWYNSDDLDSLRAVHLERCPRLQQVFPDALPLPCLETLTIKFCGKLKQVFYSLVYVSASEHQKLHTMRLLELPQLLHIREEEHEHVYFPALKVLQVRGCWRLRRLPLLPSKSPTDGNAHHLQQQVEISGEPKWWNSLLWDHYDTRRLCRKDCCIHFKPSPLFSATAKPKTRARSRRSRRWGT